jgi:hypothetical protein
VGAYNVAEEQEHQKRAAPYLFHGLVPMLELELAQLIALKSVQLLEHESALGSECG